MISLARPLRRGAPLRFRIQASLRHQSTSTPITAQLPPRWLSDLKARLGHCMTFGLSPSQNSHAAQILRTLSTDWRTLLAGSEGYLTSPERTSLYRWPVAWGEQDSMGHVNNVMYNRYAESGRVAWAQKYGKFVDPAHGEVWRDLATPRGSVGMILRKITTEFKFPMKYPDHITVYHKLHAEPGEADDAFMLDVLILSELHQRPAARCYEDCALYDYNLAKKTTMLPWMTNVLRETWRLQRVAKQENNAKVAELLVQVKKIEQESWDRKDAVEAFG